jgi:hypothetical protein
MPLIKYVKKGPSVNTFEQFYIRLYALNNQLVNEQYPGEHNPLFQLLNNFLLRHNHVTWELYSYPTRTNLVRVCPPNVPLTVL